MKPLYVLQITSLVNEVSEILKILQKTPHEDKTQSYTCKQVNYFDRMYAISNDVKSNVRLSGRNYDISSGEVKFFNIAYIKQHTLCFS